MLEPLEEIEVDEFMTTATTEWCRARLKELGFTGELTDEDDDQRPFFKIYVQLRQLIQEHLKSGDSPTLELTPAPTGGTERYISKAITFY